ncbi:hypothetical protein LDENG_00175090 [Lucifuga dentata]|nr:hypothetical protein LDENG_00175090 [Lucifuga dentata]
MLWGCFRGERSGDLVQGKGIMKKENYHSILQRHAIPSSLQIIGQNFIPQEDNDPNIHHQNYDIKLLHPFKREAKGFEDYDLPRGSYFD